MRRIHILLAALAALAISAGVATAHVLPTASDNGLNTARDASSKDVPMGFDHGATLGNDVQPASEPSPEAAPSADNHGTTVSDAAKNPTPSGDWANHGAYVSSIAKGWGQAQASAHANPTAAPSAAQQGLSHAP